MITTSANRIKRGQYWCEDADEITVDLLKSTEYNLDSEIPIAWILEHAGLANTLLALGAVRPRFQPKADMILLNYVRNLYSEVRLYMINNDIPTLNSINVPHWISNSDRKQASAVEYKNWLIELSTIHDPATQKLYETMTLLFSEQPVVLKAIHGTKFYLGGYAIKHGFKEADIAKQKLREYLKDQLEKYNG